MRWYLVTLFLKLVEGGSERKRTVQNFCYLNAYSLSINLHLKIKIFAANVTLFDELYGAVMHRQETRNFQFAKNTASVWSMQKVFTNDVNITDLVSHTCK